MFIEIQKTETVEIEITETQYRKLGNSYYKFIPREKTVEVLHFRCSEDENMRLNLQVRSNIYDHEIKILQLTSEYSESITEEHFDTMLRDALMVNI